MDVKIKTALVSVSDKDGVVEFAKNLSEMGVRIISTGGTSRTISEAGIDVVSVDSVTGFPEMMNGRVKTLHPKIHGGLLALRDNPEHAASNSSNLTSTLRYPGVSKLAKLLAIALCRRFSVFIPALIRVRLSIIDSVRIISLWVLIACQLNTPLRSPGKYK